MLFKQDVSVSENLLGIGIKPGKTIHFAFPGISLIYWSYRFLRQSGIYNDFRSFSAVSQFSLI
jgi:hypothetical protein